MEYLTALNRLVESKIESLAGLPVPYISAKLKHWRRKTPWGEIVGNAIRIEATIRQLGLSPQDYWDAEREVILDIHRGIYPIRIGVIPTLANLLSKDINYNDRENQ